MIIKRTLLAISLVGFFSLFIANIALAKGIMGFQPGDRSPEENSDWLEKAVELIRKADKDAKEGNGEESAKHGRAAFVALKEINSEGWAAKLEKSYPSIRKGIRAAKKGELEKASLDYQTALKKLEGLKYGDMNFTHESIFGIGDHR